jgi:hypothetical protein
MNHSKRMKARVQQHSHHPTSARAMHISAQRDTVFFEAEKKEGWME